MKRRSLFASIGCSLIGIACSATGTGPSKRGLESAESGGASGSATAGQAGSGGTGGGIIGSGGTAGIDIVIEPIDGDSGTSAAGAANCDSVLAVTVRDFKETHPDFQTEQEYGVRRGLVEPSLGANGKPVFKSSMGCWGNMNSPLACSSNLPSRASTTNATNFEQWYTTVTNVNVELQRELTLTETPPGSGEYLFESADYFPLGAGDGFGITPANNVWNKNYLFTTEIHVTFGYESGQVFSFRGDDDVWIFVNGKLALDIGGVHLPEGGTIDFDARAAELGISPGNNYPMDIFHAERHTEGSNFKFTTNIRCFTPVIVK